jgi:plastocyanin
MRKRIPLFHKAILAAKAPSEPGNATQPPAQRPPSTPLFTGRNRQRDRAVNQGAETHVPIGMNPIAALSGAAVAAAVITLASCSSSGGSSSPGSSAPASSSSATTKSGGITISNFAYSGTLTVKAGQKVTVTNNDSMAHTLTDKATKKFDTGNIDGNGGTGTFTAPSQPGTYKFGCTYHPNMAGTLTVTS